MQKIDVEAALKKAGHKLWSKEVTGRIFPGLKAPEMRLYKIRAGKAELTESQINNLADVCGVSIATLQGGLSWERKGDVHTFTSESGDVVVTFDGEILTVTEKGRQLLAEAAPELTLNQLINFINI